MTSLCDGALLKKYVSDSSQAAFTVLVSRHLNLVYSAALRRLNGNHASAADVAQIVFADLARKAPNLIEHPMLVGWLYRATQLAACEEIRHAMQRLSNTKFVPATESETPLVTDISPSLDTWLAELRAPDRELLLLRFIEGHSYLRLANLIGIKEDAARMRVERALQRLRETARRKGIVSTAEAIAALLVEQGAIAAPEHVAQSVLTSSVAASLTRGNVGGIATGSGLSIGVFAVVATLAILSLAGLAWHHLKIPGDHVGSGAQVRALQVQHESPPSSQQSRAQTMPLDDVAPRVHVDVQDLPPDAPTSVTQPHALLVNGEPYAAEIATTMYWRNPLELTADQKEIVQAAYQTMRREEAAQERALARVNLRAPDRVDLIIPPYAGETLLVQFGASLDRWLGPGMGNRFFDAYHGEILRDGRGFGEFPQTIILRRAEPDLVEIRNTFQFIPSLTLNLGDTKISVDTPVSESTSSLLPMNMLGTWDFLGPFVPLQ
jgi:RNA polymerase sigma factor (sigma-70 family)